MYGLVNIAIRDLIIEKHGEEVWRKVLAKANVDDNPFLPMESFPDEMTYDLVGAASEVLGVPGPDLLNAFGQYWMTFTAEKGYGQILEFAGNDLETFLSNLDDMHARIALSLPELDPPSFDVEQMPGGKLMLHYYSDRPGLAPMVQGLLLGLGKRFGVEVSVEHLPQGEDLDHDRFVIQVESGKNAKAA